MYDLCIFLSCFCSKIIFEQKIFLYVEINLPTRGPLHTCLVSFVISWGPLSTMCLVSAFSVENNTDISAER